MNKNNYDHFEMIPQKESIRANKAVPLWGLEKLSTLYMRRFMVAAKTAPLWGLGKLYVAHLIANCN